jgi:hypothetical protein
MAEPKLLAVLDASVLVRAFLSTRTGSPARRVFEAGVLGVFDAIASEQLRVETYDVLGRPSVGGYDLADIDAVLEPLWAVTTWLKEAADPDGKIAASVPDPKDAYLLRTAAAVYEGAIGWREDMFIVTENARDFPPGSTWGDFRFVDCVRFLQRLR